MNRRKFFGMTAGALVAAGLPLSLLPDKKIFLAPSGGLWILPTIRECAQYLINQDVIKLRFDLGWTTANGAYGQAFYAPEHTLREMDFILGNRRLTSDERLDLVWRDVAHFYREDARRALYRMLPVGAHPVAPKLPTGAYYAAHV